MITLDHFSLLEGRVREASPALVLFDLDGTLVNSEPLHIQAIVYTLTEFDQTVSLSDLMQLQAKGINEKMVGVNDSRVYEIIAEELGVTYQHSIDELIEQKNDFLKGEEVLALLKSAKCCAPELMNELRKLKDQGHRLGLVSASQREFVDHVVNSLGWQELFELVICREDTEFTKPNPAPYLKAFELTQSVAHEVLIFEDSDTGLKSALDSGAQVTKVSWY